MNSQDGVGGMDQGGSSQTGIPADGQGGAEGTGQAGSSAPGDPVGGQGGDGSLAVRKGEARKARSLILGGAGMARSLGRTG